jgi:hypothetical protein
MSYSKSQGSCFWKESVRDGQMLLVGQVDNKEATGSLCKRFWWLWGTKAQTSHIWERAEEKFERENIDWPLFGGILLPLEHRSEVEPETESREENFSWERNGTKKSLEKCPCTGKRGPGGGSSLGCTNSSVVRLFPVRLCPSKIPMLNANPQCDRIRNEPLGRSLGNEDLPSWMGLVLIEDTPELASSWLVRTQRKGTRNGKQALRRHGICWHCDLGLPSF